MKTLPIRVTQCQASLIIETEAAFKITGQENHFSIFPKKSCISFQEVESAAAL